MMMYYQGNKACDKKEASEDTWETEDHSTSRRYTYRKSPSTTFLNEYMGELTGELVRGKKPFEV